jgi:hypothetical protein
MPAELLRLPGGALQDHDVDERPSRGIDLGMPEIPDNPMFNMRPNTPIYGARYDPMMDAFGGKNQDRRPSCCRFRR